MRRGAGGCRALEDLVRTVSEFRVEFTDAGPLTIAGVLITRADRTLVSKQIESEVRAYFGPLVYERVVPASVKFREAYARGTPLIHYDRFSAGAEAYRAAAQAYLAGGHRHEPSAIQDMMTELLKASLTRADRCRHERSSVNGSGQSSQGIQQAQMGRRNQLTLTARMQRAGGMSHEQRDETRGNSWPGEPDRADPAEHDRGRVRAPARHAGDSSRGLRA